MSGWHWPQWVALGLYTFGVVMAVSRHGEPRENYDGPGTFFAAIVSIWILWCGGFWG